MSQVRLSSRPVSPLTFIAARFCVVVAFASACLSIPLMGQWTPEFHLTSGDIVQTVAVYVVGFLIALLFFARLSNSIGRKYSVIAALVFGLASTAAFIGAGSLTGLLLGRFLQGLYCGLTSSAAMSWAIDSAPARNAWLGPAVSTAAPGVGFTIGTVSAGALMQYGGADSTVIFEGLLVIQAAALAAAFLAQETNPGTEALVSALMPKVSVPSRYRPRLVLAESAFIGCWALVCFFQGFSAMTAQTVFETETPVAMLTTAVYLMIVLPNTFGAVAMGKFNPKRFLVILTGLYFIFGNILFWSINESLPVMFCISAVVAGAVMGGICSLALKLLTQGAKPEERAPLISALYLAGQIGTTIPSFAIAFLARTSGFSTIAVIFGVWFALVFVAVVWALKRLEHLEAIEKVSAVGQKSAA